MNTLSVAIVFAFINTIILVVIYFYLYRQYGEKALKVWAISWLVYSLRFVAMFLAQKYGDHYFLLIGHQSSSLISGILLLYGVYQYAGMKMPIYWSAGFAACMAWSFSLPFANQGYFVYTLPVSVFIGAIFLWTGIAFLKARTQKSLGTVITGVAFIIWAFHKLNNPLLRPDPDIAHWGYFISSTLIVFVAVGILISYFERVRFKLLAHEKALDSALLDSIKRETQITLLLEGARNILENRGFADTGRFIFESCKKFTGATCGSVAVLSKDERCAEVVFLDTDGRSGGKDALPPVPVRGLCAESCRTGSVTYKNSLSPGECSEIFSGVTSPPVNVMFAPLVVEGKPLGYILLANKADGFDDTDMQITRAFADLASIALMNGMSREMLEKSESRFRTLVESMNDVVFTLDRDQRHTGVYGRWGESYRVDLEHFIGKTAVELMGKEAGGIHAAMNGRTLEGDNVTYEWCVPGPGETVHMQTSLSPLRDAQGVIHGIVGVGRDITRLKEAETRLENSLREKELLLKEVHHRVKNNMQIISSLVNLQSQRTGEESHRKLFQETSARVRAMALVHEKLYQSRDFARINFREYVKELVSGLMESYGRGPSRIGVDIQVEDMDIGIDRAIPCAQIINELVTNTLKYAFPDGMDGVLEISFGKTDRDGHLLVVADNGAGIPAGFDPGTTRTLGLQMVNGLVKQLQGSLELDRSSGTRFIISFN